VTRRFLSAAELAEELGLSKKTIQNKVSAGTFPVRHVKIGRLTKFYVGDVESYIAALKKLGGTSK